MARIQGDLKERTACFAEAIVNVSDDLPNNNKGWVLGRQLIRAGTSIGSNVYEAEHARSDADFAYRCSVARKESSETFYWLDLCRRCGLLEADKANRLAAEADELMRILSAIVKRTEDYLQGQRERELTR